MCQLIIDEDLIRKVRAVAGRDIHDTESAIGLYISTTFNINKCSEVPEYNKMSRAYPHLSWYEGQKLIRLKNERILRSFLVTKDIKLSKKLIEDYINKGDMK